MRSDWYGTGSKVKVLMREFERNYPGEILPEQVPDSAGIGEKASGAAALADSAVRESVPNRRKGGS